MNRNSAMLNPERSGLPHSASKINYNPEISGLITHSKSVSKNLVLYLEDQFLKLILFLQEGINIGIRI